jgi:hypothetical protein
LRRRPGARELAKVVAWLAVPIVVLNTPYWVRNISSSGGPFGPRLLVGAYTVEGNVVAALSSLPANLVRAGLLHLASPSQTLNEQLSAWGSSLGGVSEAVGTEFYLIWRWNHENFATAPVQLGLALLSIPLSSSCAKTFEPVLTGYLLVAVSLPLAVVPWFATAALPNSGVRYQMPIFAVWAPLVGIAVVAMFRTRGAMLGWALIALSIPWVLFNWSRPLIGMRPHPEGLEVGCHPLLGCTSVGSVLETPPVEIVFAESPGLQGAYRRAALAVREGTQRRGLHIDSTTPSTRFGGFCRRIPNPPFGSSRFTRCRSWSVSRIQTSARAPSSAPSVARERVFTG